MVNDESTSVPVDSPNTLHTESSAAQSHSTGEMKVPSLGTTGDGQTSIKAVPAIEPAAAHTENLTGKSNGKNGSWIKRAGIAVVVLGLIAYFGIPMILYALNTVSTDDAYVNSHVTFVAPRVPGQVTKVLVDDNNRVRKGDLVVQLDREPYEIQLRLKQAAVDSANADLLAARDQVRGQAAQARSNRFKLERSIEDVHNQIAQLAASVATLESKKATVARAAADFERGKNLVGKGAVSRQELDRYEQEFLVGQAEVKQALEQVYQVRVSLGLPPQPKEGEKLTDVPADLDQTFSSVRQAAGALLQSAAPLGLAPSSYDLTPKEIIAEFLRRDPDGNVDRIYSELTKNASAIKQAEAKLLLAERDLDQAKLNLRYCDVFAEIDGVVTRRNVNPGNNLLAGQALMAIRSLTEIWIDANFKETQLAELRIGQRVELEVDMYGRHRKIEGRITGFTMGTGSTLALLPAQNATGNFIKVVQRLPVRIEPVNYNPDKDPLFVGLSVVPRVFIHEAPTGPDAGKVLQPNLFTTVPPAAGNIDAAGPSSAAVTRNAESTKVTEARQETAP